MKRKLAALILAALLCIGCAACGASSSTSSSASAQTLSAEAASTADMFTDRDFEVGYSDYVTVTLADGASSADGTGVSVDGNTVTITQEGTYLLTGTLTDGQIVVDADETAKIQIVLDGACVTCAGSAALYVKQADKVFVTLAESTENTLASTGEFVQTDDNTVDGAIFAKSDLTLNGKGTLTVTSESGHGIVSKDDLKITSGTYVVTAASQGLSGKDSVRIADGTFTITAGADGIHSSNDEDTSKGFIYIANGTFTVDAQGDDVDASGTLTILDGTFALTSGGGSANAPARTNSDMPGMGGGMHGGPGGAAPSSTDSTSADSATAAAVTTAATVSADSSASEDTTTSTKGLKADQAVLISGGTFTIDSADDAVHTNADLSVSGGEFTIKAGDDGMHADSSLTISGGTIDITESYEGIEGSAITVSGGTTSVVSSDDGLNASSSTDSDAIITISGGQLTVNADGDGIDSNGSLSVTGGTTYVSGPTNSGNGALDYNDSATITGGVLIAAGATGMDQNFGSDSTQGSILYQLSSVQAAGTTITLKNSDGSVLASYTPVKEFQSVVVSAPGIESGSTYTLTVGSASESIEMTDLIYGTGSEMGGAGGNMGGGGMGGGPRGGNGGTPPDRGNDATTGATPSAGTSKTTSNG